MSGFSFYLLLFSASGFAALIYENAWTQYLKLVLGHSAHAQLLVLVVFMGGMAIGAWICAHYSHRIKNLLKTYAWIEFALGAMGIVFHPIFLKVSHWLLASSPDFSSLLLVESVTWLTAVALILPQSILLGMTFPLMTGAVLRRVPNQTGRTVSLLYFINSLGGAGGVLVSGYWLIGVVGLPGTILTAGSINILIGLLAWIAASSTEQRFKKDKTTLPSKSVLPLTILMIAGSSGFSAFCYEMGWIRMLSMVIGSSSHAFELMLSAFIFGLAFGSLYAKRVIRRSNSLLRSLGYAQLLMGVAALVTLPLYNLSFDVVYLLMRFIPRTSTGYIAFQILSEGFCFLFMLPATFFAGMTLPLITEILLRKGYGEKSLGRVYAFNTFGAILGAVSAQWWLMPWLGLKSVIGVGALVNIVIGCWIVFALIKTVQWAVGAFSVVSAAGILGFVHLDAFKMSAGVFRGANIEQLSEREVLFHQDGRLATVFTMKTPDMLYISTNGKTDASISLNAKPSRDESAQILLGALPWSMLPSAKQVAVIGIGSGTTTATLLHTASVESVDTLEIEPAMVAGAKFFPHSAAAVFHDPRSHIITEDARRYFARTKKQYDLIISEPSNPWVSGVSDLFTEEFYQIASKRLSSNGIFTQWVGLYDLSPELLASIMKALRKSFSYYAVYLSDSHNIIICASQNNALQIPSAEIFSIPNAKNSLKRIGISTLEDLALHRLGNQKDLGAFFATFATKANSDYFRVLEQRVDKEKFLNLTALKLATLKYIPLPLRLLSEQPINAERIDVNSHFNLSYLVKKGLQLYETLVIDSKVESFDRENHLIVSTMENPFSLCQGQVGEEAWLDSFRLVMEYTLPFLSKENAQRLFGKIRPKDCFIGSSSRVKSWVNLYDYLIYEDYAAVLQTAQTILQEQDNQIDQIRGTGFAVYACLKLGRIEEAKRLLENCPRKLRYDLQLRYLAGLTSLALYGTATHVKF